MAFIIDTINGSGLYAQSAASASLATYDSNGNVITATYITGVDLTPYQTTAGMTAYATTGDVANKLDSSAFNIPASSNWNSTYNTVHSNSASWNENTINSYNLSAGKNINITKDDVNSAIGLEVTGLNKYQTTAGMKGYLTTGQYETDSAVFNAKQDALTFGYDTNDAISSINNSAITQPPSQKLYLQSPLTTGVSAGSAYIGIAPSAMYNETVLWSGTAAPSNFPLTMSEPFSAFEKIEFIWDARYNGDYGTPTKGTIIYTDNYGSTRPTKYTLIEAYANGNQTWWDWWYLENNNNGKTLTNYKALYFPMTGGSSATQTNCRLFKVVGINRKENS